MTATILALASDSAHRFSKRSRDAIRLLAGWGIEGDAHAGATVQHLSRIAKNPAAPNLRQVHLVHAELFDELAARGFRIGPGDIGENVTTWGIDLLGLSRGTRLRLGREAEIEVTGLRNPCLQLDRLAPGLMAATLDRAPDGSLIRKAGVMAIVLTGGDVMNGDRIEVSHRPETHCALQPV